MAGIASQRGTPSPNKASWGSWFSGSGQPSPQKTLSDSSKTALLKLLENLSLSDTLENWRVGINAKIAELSLKNNVDKAALDVLKKQVNDDPAVKILKLSSSGDITSSPSSEVLASVL